MVAEDGDSTAVALDDEAAELGYGVALEEGQRATEELMVSLKIL